MGIGRVSKCRGESKMLGEANAAGQGKAAKQRTKHQMRVDGRGVDETG